MNEKDTPKPKRNRPTVKKTLALGAAATVLFAGSNANNKQVEAANSLQDSHQQAQYQKYINKHGSENLNAVDAGIEALGGVVLALGALAEGGELAAGSIRRIQAQRTAESEAANAAGHPVSNS